MITFVAIASLALQLHVPTLEGRLIIAKSQIIAESISVSLETVTGVPVDRTFPDPTGYFQFHDVAPGAYELRVDEPGYELVEFPLRFPETVRVVINMRRLPSPGDDAVKSRDGTFTVDVEELALPAKAKNEYEKGILESKDHDSKRAISHFRRALQIAPQYYRAHLALANEYVRTGQESDAEKLYLKAAGMRPADPEALMELGALCLRKRELQSAADAFEEAVKRRPNSFAALGALGMTLYYMQQFEWAETVLVRAQHIQPTNAMIRLLLINSFLKQAKFKDALEQVDKYLEENPNGNKKREVEDIRSKLLTVLDRPNLQR